MELAAQLGSDVPFFLGRGAAICRGRGEQIGPIAPPRLHVVVARPPVGLSTPDVYARCKPSGGTGRSSMLVADLKRGDMAAAAKRLENGLEKAATELTPWIGRLKE